MGLGVAVAAVKDATSFGRARCVGIGTGLFKTFSAAVESWVRIEKIFELRDRVHQEYAKHSDHWRMVYAGVMKIVSEGLLTPMWRAPWT
jgi:autoinducer 2 (AI-2) kinase